MLIISIVFITKKESFNNPNPKPVFDFDKLVEYGLSQKVYNFIHGDKGPKGIKGQNAPDPQNLDDYLDSIKSEIDIKFTVENMGRCSSSDQCANEEDYCRLFDKRCITDEQCYKSLESGNTEIPQYFQTEVVNSALRAQSDGDKTFPDINEISGYDERAFCARLKKAHEITET